MMKLFIVVIIAATAIGGFIGGEMTGSSFTVTGAAIAGVGLTVILLSLGALFSHREDKKRAKQLPPEMRDVFERMAPRHKAGQAQFDATNLTATMNNLMDQDRAMLERGEVPERRLIPHHAIKRDVIICAYTKDYDQAILQIKDMDWTDQEIKRREDEEDERFNDHINGVKRMDQDDLDKVIKEMKETRTDFAELEATIRSVKPLYKIVDPL